MVGGSQELLLVGRLFDCSSLDKDVLARNNCTDDKSPCG
jgi:hypothetical protein